MSEENTVVEESSSESIVEIAKDSSTVKRFKGESWLSCSCKGCGREIRNEKAIDGVLKCKCGAINKC